MVKIYDLIKEVLTEQRETRDSDKKLIWEVWTRTGFVYGNHISYVNFLKSPSHETIRRCRQKIQEKFPELRASDNILRRRHQIAKEKGTFIYREQGTLI